jgi:Protein of unknown function (DUF3014)
MDKSIIFILIFIVVSGVAYYFWQEHEASLVLNNQEAEPLVEVVEPLPQVVEEEEIRYPVPEQIISPVEEEEIEQEVQVIAEIFSLPSLEESDVVIQEAFVSFYESVKLAKLFIFREFVRHVVVSIDNMTTKKLPRRFVFTQSPDASFMVSKTADENEFILDELNFERYRPFIQFADAVDTQQLVSLYVRYYPLFQEAYDELGYPGRYFNDRLIEVIDHLLQTPEVQGPLRLLRPKVFYQFADPALERLSAGQKVLLRIGNDNALLVKTRLKELRRILTTLGPGQ